MNFDPQKFFIGLMDFFSILLPGAMLTYLLMGEVGPVVLGDRYDKPAGWGECNEPLHLEAMGNDFGVRKLSPTYDK